MDAVKIDQEDLGARLEGNVAAAIKDFDESDCRILGFGLLVIGQDGRVNSGFAAAGINHIHLIGALELLKANVLEEMETNDLDEAED